MQFEGLLLCCAKSPSNYQLNTDDFNTAQFNITDHSTRFIFFMFNLQVFGKTGHNRIFIHDILSC